MARMAGSVREHPKGSGVWRLYVTVPRALCITARSADRRASVMVGPKPVATMLAREVDGLLSTAALTDTKVRARDILRQAAGNARGQMRGASPDPASPTVADYADSWLRTVKGSSHDQYRRVYNHRIKPTFGTFPLNQIPRRLIREWIHAMESEGLEGPTIGTYFRTFAAMLAQAERDELIDRHPCSSISKILPGFSHGKSNKRALTVPELAAAIRANRERSVNPHRLAIEIMAATGLRIGEIVALRWTDLRGNELAVERQLFRGKVTQPKGRASREVVLADSLVGALRAYRVELQERALAAGKRASVWMLPRPDGKPYSDQSVRKAWLEVVRAAGLLPEGVTMQAAGLGPHVLRHTWITHRLQEGVPVADVSKAAGHTSPAITMRHYAHALPQERERLRVDLDALTGGE